MNSDIKNQVNKINTMLKEDPTIVEYNKLAKEIAENSDINELESKLKELQHKLCHELDSSLEEERKTIEVQIAAIKDSLEDNPLYNTYKEYKENLDSMLKNIEDILNNL